MLTLGMTAAVVAGSIDIGSRRELFVDNYLIDRLERARQQLHHPVPREVAIVHDAPWEGNGCMYTTVFRDGDIYRMYYRGAQATYRGGKAQTGHEEVTCYAQSRDGIHWTKPELGICEFNGSKQNNIILTPAEAEATHNFSPFRDMRPGVASAERYKAIGGFSPLALASPDGIHWKKMQDRPVITKGRFDSQNVAFWDQQRGEYRAYWRDLRNGRDIRTATSKDFLNWSESVFIDYTPGRISDLYTNQISPYYRAPHILLGFPTRYIDPGWQPSTEALPQLEYRRLRSSSTTREGTALTDGMFMSSRDGYLFQVWPESFIRPGLRLKDNWFYGDNYQNWGLVETSSHIEGAPAELSLYVSEANSQNHPCRHRRYTLRIDGFVSVQAPLSGGELVTKPIIFSGNSLVLNFSTSVAGSIQVEIQDAIGEPISGYTLADCDKLYGDSLERVVTWENGPDVDSIAGKPIRLRFVLKDADLFSFQFRQIHNQDTAKDTLLTGKNDP